MVTCLMGGGSYMTDETREALYRHALTMFTEKIKRRNFATQSCAGFITSEFDYTTLETDQGTKTVKYLVRAKDLAANEDGVWIHVSLPRRPTTSSSPASSMAN